MKKFISDNRVFLSGLVSALILGIQQIMKEGPVSYKVLGLALVMAVLSYLANEWKAKTASVLGVFGSLSGAIVLQLEKGFLSWGDLGLVLALGLLSFFSEGLKAPENREFIPNKP